jgi:DNA invertase Pin-like site-specific DNA recombinase
MTSTGYAPLRIIGLTRKSKGEDEGTHVDQRRIIEDRCAREGFTLVRVDSEKGISGTKAWRNREVGRAIEDVKAGRADGIVVAFEDRISRESMAETAALWDTFREVGLVFIACDGVDSRVEGSNLTFAIKAAIARDKIEVTAKRSNLGRKRAVEDFGIHGGDDAPLGYRWTPRPDGAKNLRGNVKHSPLDIDPDTAPRVVQCFEARAAGAGTRELCRITGLSDSGVRDLLRNRVYLGTAYSGEFEKPGAHPALVSEELFARVQRTWQHKRPSKIVGRDKSLLSRVLVCATCGGVGEGERVRHLVFDRSLGSYRCKNEQCPAQVTITADRIEGYVFHEALAWHAVLNPMYEVETSEALPEVMKALVEALEERDEIEGAEGLSALRKAQALTEADGKITQLESVLAEVEASNGWLGMNTEAVQKRLLADGPVEVKEGRPAPRCSDLRAGNEFIREMVWIVVKPVGRGRKVPVADRVEVNCLTPAAVAQEVEVA